MPIEQIPPTLFNGSPKPRVAIAGAGLVGRLLAWQLLLEGLDVTLFDKGQLKQGVSAAHTAAAMISPMSEVVVSEHAIYRMGCESLRLWPQWLETLNLNAPVPIQYSAGGSLAVAHPNDEAELDQFQQELNFHLGHNSGAKWLDRQQLENIEPDIAPQFERALFLPNEAYLDNRALLDQLLHAIGALGGKCIENTTINWTPAPSTNGVPLEQYDWVFDCRGVGAVDGPKSVRGVRGEVLWVHTDEVTLHHPIRLMHPRYKLYIVPKPDQQFIIGATEIESADRSPVSIQSMLELCSALYTLNPAFAEARIQELDANLRPSHIDNLPNVEKTQHTLRNGRLQHCVHMNGLYRHGYLLAPHIVHTTINALKTNREIDL